MRSFLVAVVVPNETALRAWAKESHLPELGGGGGYGESITFEELCQLESVQRVILSSLSSLCSLSGRPGWEAPKVCIYSPPPYHSFLSFFLCIFDIEIISWNYKKGVLLDHEPFTETNGLLTPSEKLNRRALLAHYGDRLAALYEALEKRLENVRGVLLEDVLPRTLGETMLLQEGDTLINDSLSAVRLMQVLRDRYTHLILKNNNK